MGSYAYILVAAFVLTGSVFLFSQQSDTNRADLDLGRLQMKQEARNAAATGLAVSMRKLAQDTSAWLVADSFETGPHSYTHDDEGRFAATYQTEVTIVDTITGDTLDIVATGTKPYVTRSGAPSDTTHIIEVRIARGIIQHSTPPGLRAAIISDNRMRIHGDFSLQALLPGVNADIHTNDVLRSDGNSFLVQGMGTYSVGSEVRQDDNFQPPNDWNGAESNVFWRQPIDIPVWDHVAFATDAQTNGYYTTSDLTVDGDVLALNGITTIDDYAEQILGLPAGDYGVSDEDPFLIMVDDSTSTLRFVNSVNLSGYFQFGTTGNIEVDPQGNPGGLMFDYTADIPNETAYTHVGLFTTQAIRVAGNAEIHATLYAGGAITYLGGTTLYGGQIADETTFQGGGTINIYWVGAGTSVEEYFEGYDEPVGPVIIAFAEW